MREKNWYKAIGFYERIVVFHLNGASDWVQYGHALKEVEDLDKAEWAYRQAVLIEPHAVDAHRQLGFLLKRLNRLDEAKKSFINGLSVALAEEDLAREVRSFGVCGREFEARLTLAALEMGGPSPYERERARRRLRNPRIRSLVRGARRSSSEGKWSEARAQYEEIISIDPYQPRIHVQLGHARKEGGDLDAAIAAYRCATSWAPHDPDPHLHLGHVLKLKDDRAGAVSEYSNAWRLQPGFPDVERELRDYAGWSDDCIDHFGVENWTGRRGIDGGLPGAKHYELDAASASRIDATRPQPERLDAREGRVWRDLALARGWKI